jgi:hypothetical protein
MKAAHCHTVTFSPIQEQRIDQAGKILDSLDIARRLIDQAAPDNRLALARQLIRQVADEVVTLARLEDQPAASAEVAP